MTKTRRERFVAVAAGVTCALVTLAGCGTGDEGRSDSWLKPGSPPPSRPGANVAVVGLPSLIVTSTDGGSSWRTTRRGPTDDLTQLLLDVAFCDSKHGWAVGTDSTLLATVDGGATWVEQQSRVRDGTLYRVVTTDRRHAWVLGSERVSSEEWGPSGYATLILSTTDGGATWSKRRFGVNEEHRLVGISFCDSSHGWAVESDPTADGPLRGVILATTDGGVHWAEQYSEVKTASFSGVAFSDSKHGLAVGTRHPASGYAKASALIMVTSDGGAHWTTALSGEGGGLSDVAFPDARNGWAVGAGGTILATTDGGATWTTQDSGYSKRVAELPSVAFSDARYGWIVIGKLALLATADGGATWTTVRPTDDIIFAVTAVGPPLIE